MPSSRDTVATMTRKARSLLRPVRDRASQAVYGDATTYRVRLHGTTTTYSTVEPAAYRWFYPRYAFGRLHEKPVTLRMVEDLRSAACFADVGANLGFYTCLATRFMPAGREVHAFEMDVDNFAMLERNVALNPSDVEVTTRHAAVSSAAGEVTYRRRPQGNHPALSLYNPFPEDGAVDVTVPALALDDYFRDRRAPDVVKVDVEGAELDVLRGMRGLLPEVRRMYVEVHPQNLELAGQSAAEVLHTLGEHFDLFLLPGHRSQRTASWESITPDTAVAGNTILLATQRS